MSLNFKPLLYANKIALGPMVRAGRTPLRMLALEYGADLVYTEEIIDERLLQTRRVVNDLLGCVDYTIGNDIVLRIAKEEASKCILQIGTSTAEKAVQICMKFGQDVAAIDVNMGCPMPFSTCRGMGAALLSEPGKVKEILTSMVANSPVPVSCKIRVQYEPEETLKFAKMIQSCGVSAIGVHGRRKYETHTYTNRIDEIRDVANSLSIPVLANGCSSIITSYDDIKKCWQESGCSSIMISRKGLTHPSIFRKDGLLTMSEQIERFLDKACELDEEHSTKYVVQRILKSAATTDPRGVATVSAGSVLEVCQAWGKEEKYLECKQHRLSHLQKQVDKFALVDGVHVGYVTFPRKKLADCSDDATPECVLNKLCDDSNAKRPLYTAWKSPFDGRFITEINVMDKRFKSTVLQRNKTMAKQVACLTALIGLDQKHLIPEHLIDYLE